MRAFDRIESPPEGSCEGTSREFQLICDPMGAFAVSNFFATFRGMLRPLLLEKVTTRGGRQEAERV